MPNSQNINNSGIIRTVNNIQINTESNCNSDNNAKQIWHISTPLAVIADIITVFLFANACISHVENMMTVPIINIGPSQTEPSTLLSLLWPFIIIAGLAIGLMGAISLVKMIFGTTKITPRLLGKYQNGKIEIYLLDKKQNYD